MNNDCVFCKIVANDIPNYRIWEDTDFLAFLSIFPNTKGTTVVIPKKHYESYAFALPDEVLCELIKATKKVANLLDEKLDDVGRTAMVFEGYGVNHIHAKLFPMHGTKNKEWQQHISPIKTYFEKYEGYISSNDSELADSDYLEKLSQKIKINLKL